MKEKTVSLGYFSRIAKWLLHNQLQWNPSKVDNLVPQNLSIYSGVSFMEGLTWRSRICGHSELLKLQKMPGIIMLPHWL